MSDTTKPACGPTNYVWGARAIGAVIGKDARATFYLLEEKELPATKIGRQWVSTPEKLHAYMRGESGGEAA